MWSSPALVVALFVVAASSQPPLLAPSASGSAAPATSPNASATTPLSGPPTFPVTLLSTNPTAVPLASLTVNPPPQSTVPLDTTYAAGATPTVVSGAPPLPDISTLSPANYPALDKVPPTDSPQVQQWISELSGFTFPDINATVAGGCPANLAAVADTNRCWWTCSQCTRSTDIITCPDRLTWGSSFDDGPSPYSPSLVQYLNQQSLKTTFFVVGSRAISRPDFLRSEYMGGHQIAVHTWSHPSLTTLTNEQVIAEFGWSKKIIKDVIGVTPIYFRPPFGDIDDRIRAIAAAMDLIPIIWTSGVASNHVSFDTNDFNIPAGTVSASGVIDNFNNILGNASTLNTGFIVLEHDLFQQSVDLATGYILPQALAMRLTLKPIISCLNLPLSDAYLETNNNSTNPLPTAVGTSVIPHSTNGANASPGSSGSPANGNQNAATGMNQKSDMWSWAGGMLVGLIGAAAAL
ncbi:glycoside hydrolase/deacetylase [Hysterangium stoloniferum]|nr:glycoside hydrolase/deacetylase [Hysterangium stoloniferum]